MATTLGTLISRDKNEIHTVREENEDKDAIQMVSVSANAGQGIGEVGCEGAEKELLVNESNMATQQKAGNSTRV